MDADCFPSDFPFLFSFIALFTFLLFDFHLNVTRKKFLIAAFPPS